MHITSYCLYSFAGVSWHISIRERWPSVVSTVNVAYSQQLHSTNVTRSSGCGLAMPWGLCCRGQIRPLSHTKYSSSVVTLMQKLYSIYLTFSLPKVTIGAYGTVREATIVAHIPWLLLATIGAVFTKYQKIFNFSWKKLVNGSQKSSSERVKLQDTNIIHRQLLMTDITDRHTPTTVS